MATRKGGLGKGLDSLIADKVGTSNEKTDAKNEVMVNINKVEPNKEQPRKNFDEDALLELSESIKQFGVLQPLLVVDRKDPCSYIIAVTRNVRILIGYRTNPLWQRRFIVRLKSNRLLSMNLYHAQKSYQYQ